ncbi:MAG: hypothetical protein FWD45_06870, partial [Coriobacteriia bacterium]|nr:hypothetical protein [Coriobacteriia bacterium]
RVDLDLHAVTSSGAIGWYTGYRTEHCEIVYSGDVTAAPKPNGATEAMLVKGDITDLELTFSMNNFTRNNEVIPFDVIIAKGSAEDISNNYVIDPNKIIVNFCTEVAPGKAQQELGTLIKNEEALNFIVGGFATGNSRVSFTSEIQNQRRQANKLEFLHRPGFTDFLEDIVCTYRIALTHEEADFDLSLESLQADTFSQILSKPQR